MLQFPDPRRFDFRRLDPRRQGAVVTTAHLKLGIRAATAGVVSYALAWGLDLPNGYWAVLTAVLVVQSTLGASLAVAIDRALGTAVGGVIGVLAAMAAGPSVARTFLALALAVLLTSTLSAKSASFKLAPVTVVIVLLADPSHVDPWISGMHRLFEIGVGGVAGVLCALVVLPARALNFLFPYCAAALRHCAVLLALGRDGVTGRGLDPSRIDALNGKARDALRAADARIAEARAERALAGEADAAPVVRGCRRCWHSVLMLLRSADTPLSPALAEQVSPALDATVAALGAYLEALAQQLLGKAVDLAAPAAAARAAVVALEGEAERLNASGALDAASGSDLRGLYAAIAACDHVCDNLDDLVTRLAEMDHEPA